MQYNWNVHIYLHVNNFETAKIFCTQVVNLRKFILIFVFGCKFCSVFKVERARLTDVIIYCMVFDWPVSRALANRHVNSAGRQI